MTSGNTPLTQNLYHKSTFQVLFKVKSHIFKDLFSTQFDIHIINPSIQITFVWDVLQRNMQYKQEMAINVVQEIKSKTSAKVLIVSILLAFPESVSS